MRMHARARAPVATRRKRVAVAAALALRWYRGRPPCPRAGRAASAAGSSTTDKERAATIHPGLLLLLLNHHAAHASLSQGLHLCEPPLACPAPRRAARPFRYASPFLSGVRVACAPRGTPRPGLRAAVAGIGKRPFPSRVPPTKRFPRARRSHLASANAASVHITSLLAHPVPLAFPHLLAVAVPCAGAVQSRVSALARRSVPPPAMSKQGAREGQAAEGAQGRQEGVRRE
uniref:Uncharacterized protein n=1 Tax=Zea mays TaxID=4577 RepID=A0A804PUH6_MAIZE